MFPSGKHMKSGEVREKTPKELIQNMNNFTGYISFTVKDANGIHDFSAALITGDVAGAFHESFKTKETAMGEEALKKIYTYEKCTGFYDVVELNAEQVKLAVAVRPESEVKTQPSTQVDEQKPVAAAESNEEILKKYGLSSLSGVI